MKQLPKVGDKVILGKHVDSNGMVHNWNEHMDQFAGKTATVRRVYNAHGIKEKAGDSVRVDLDSEAWSWEVYYLQPVGSARSSADDGCRCSKCREWVPYVEPSDTFVCYSCRRRP